jgi:DNA-binding CsgD family transcriptional regulator/type II secretory pathway predicted ATPase ExeA
VLQWPFVGRAREFQHALDVLEEQSAYRGVVLIGEAGVGKTALARSLADELKSRGLNERFVLGTKTARAVPLAAFQRWVPVQEPHEPAVLLAAAHRALADERDLLMVVDDAHLLDRLSALLVQQVAAAGTSKMIVTIRSGDEIPDAVTALWKEQHLIRIDIKPFTRAQTGELVCAVLDGVVSDRVIDQLHELSAGIPLVLRGLLTAAVENGNLIQDGGEWYLKGPLQVGADLNDLLESGLATMAADEFEVVEIVAAAEVLDWDILRQLCDTDAVARAERRGAIQLVADGSHTIARLGHPVLREIVRKRGGVARSRQLNTLLAQHLSEFLQRARSAGAHGARADVRSEIALAQLMTRSDMDPDLPVITRAAASAVTMSNVVLGEQLAQFAYDHGGGLIAAIVLAEAKSWQGHGDEAESLLATFDPDGSDALATVRWGCTRAANLYWACGDVDAARSVLATVRDRVASPAMLGLVTAMEVSFDFFAGRLDETISVGSGACAATDLVPLAMVWVASATAGALALRGRFADVPVIAARGLVAAQRCESGLQRFAIGLAEVLALTATGEFTAAAKVCARYRDMTAGEAQANSIVDAMAGRVDLGRGALTDACDELHSALSVMTEAFPRGWVMLVAAWHAQAEAARGNSAAAAAALAQAEATTGRQVAVFWPELELARAWERAAVGETSAARVHAERAAQLARQADMVPVEMHALHTAVRFGDRSPSARLRELAKLLDSPLATAVAAHSRGLADHDGDQLDDAADGFEKLGAMAMAADAAAQAAREHARAGTRIKELESSTHAHWRASQCDLRTPATAAIERPLPITDREREIATLVAGGLSNRQISDRLNVSARTVEGHLYRIFTKLGITDRDELAHLLRARATN